MKKLLCVLWCALLLLPTAGCKRKESVSPRVWCLAPGTVAAEQAVRDMIKKIDGEIIPTFVPAEELMPRLSAALERGDGPDVFMMYGEGLPDLAEKEKLAALESRLSVGKVREDELSERARRACLYQGKTYGVPVFTDAYFLATNRALVSAPPKDTAELLEACAQMKEKGCAGFEKLPPYKKSLLYEGILREKGGDILNGRETKWAFTSEQGQEALEDCTAALKDAADEQTALGEGKAAFSVYTALERRMLCSKFPDTDIELSPLFGLERLQCVAFCLNADTKDGKRAFRILEELSVQADKLAALYKTYTAKEGLKPLSGDDENVVPHIASARPAPDIVGYDGLLRAQLPAAIDSAGKGVPAAVALEDAAKAPLGITREKSAPAS